MQPVGTVNGRGQSTLPRYLLDKAGKEIAVVGDLDNPNLETLIDLEPDLILTGQTKPELLALLKEIAPTVVTGNWGEPWKTVFGRSADAMNRGPRPRRSSPGMRPACSKPAASLPSIRASA